MQLRKRVVVVLAATVIAAAQLNATADDVRGLAATVNAKNYALTVGVSHGLPGIDLDVSSVTEIISHPQYRFSNLSLMEGQGTKRDVELELAHQAKQVDASGTFLFYFSGHGSPGGLYMQDGTLPVENMRQAIRAGRDGLPPLDRLVMVFDSCFSGSLLNPFRTVTDALDFSVAVPPTNLLVDRVMQAFQPRRDEVPYWKSLFVFASSRADETSLAGENGSVFTVALLKAFKETLTSKGNMQQWVEKTKTYTVGHHPVERFVPANLKDELIVPAMP